MSEFITQTEIDFLDSTYKEISIMSNVVVFNQGDYYVMPNVWEHFMKLAKGERRILELEGTETMTPSVVSYKMPEKGDRVFIASGKGDKMRLLIDYLERHDNIDLEKLNTISNNLDNMIPLLEAFKKEINALVHYADQFGIKSRCNFEDQLQNSRLHRLSVKFKLNLGRISCWWERKKRRNS